MMTSVSFDGKDSIKDYGFYTGEWSLGLPEPKTEKVEVPGRDGDLDISESLTGHVTFGNRTLEFNFSFESFEPMPAKLATFIMDVHGEMKKIIFSRDPDYYYKGRCTVEWSKTGHLWQIKVTVDADPYKYAVDGGEIADWLWDPFRFAEDTIYFGTFKVDGTRRVDLVNPGRKNVVPTFKVTGTVNVNFRSHLYQMSNNTYTYPDLYLSSGDNWLTFTGTGTVKSSYERTSL